MDSTGLERKVRTVLQQVSDLEPIVATAPGRINIIGEHIDYNDGLVLPMAIDRVVTTGTVLGEDLECSLYAIDLDEKFEFTLGEKPVHIPSWASYIFGTVHEWYLKEWLKKGVKVAFAGNVPQGSGLSSSAALEVSAALSIANASGISIDSRSLALHCQKVEQKYTGVNCGIMDQYASVFGKKDTVILLDCLSVTHIDIPFSIEPYSFLLCQTGVSHSLASSAYNDRRQSAELALTTIKNSVEVHTWRDVTLADLKWLEGDDILYRRSTHICQEMDRVTRSVEAIKDGRLDRLGALLYQSHADLRDNYEVSCAELDFLVDLAQSQGILGARMMGGGFGGCTLNVIHTDDIEQFVNVAKKKYREQFARDLEVYNVNIGDGAAFL